MEHQSCHCWVFLCPPNFPCTCILLKCDVLSPMASLPALSLPLSLPALPPSLPLTHSDSAWAIYIMPEEVGLRCHSIGIHILLLKSSVHYKSVGRLEIISPSNTGEPVVAWDRDKIRRTGKTGNLVFIEIGRRCQGGPGLVWMYAGFEEAHPLRETLHRSVNLSPPSLPPSLLPPPRDSVVLCLFIQACDLFSC